MNKPRLAFGTLGLILAGRVALQIRLFAAGFIYTIFAVPMASRQAWAANPPCRRSFPRSL